jgi:hypothetical protein
VSITNNVCVRTLKSGGAYSAYGFGTRYGRTGPADPTITDAHLGSEYAQIAVENHTQNLLISGNQCWGGGYGVFLDGTAGSAYLSWRNVSVQGNLLAQFKYYGVRIEGEGSANVNANTIDGDPLHTHSLRGAGGTWSNSTAHAAVSYSNGRLLVTNNTIRNVASVINGSLTDDNSWGGNTFCCDPTASSGYNAANIGIGQYANFPRYGAYQLVIEDGDPGSATFGKVKNICLNGANAMPSSGKYLLGHVVRNGTPTVTGSAGSKYVVQGWMRVTTGSAHVLNTDWVEMRCLTGT